jgi:hypothetical protein
MRTRFSRSVLIIFLILTTGACSNGAQSAPAGAVLSYLQALVDRDAPRLAALSCPDWEAAAQLELESFAAVTVTLEKASCQQTGTDGDITLVACTGKIVANYGNEVLELDLAERTYQVTQQGGDWLMCGYR